MSCVSPTSVVSVLACTTSLSACYREAGVWRSSTGIDAADFNVNVQSLVGDIEVKPGLQFAAVRTDKPDGAAAIGAGSYTSATGFVHYRENISAAGKFFVRPVLFYRIKSTGSGLGQAQLEMEVIWKSCGAVIGAQTILIQPFMDLTTDLSYFPITDYQPTLGMDKVKAAILYIDPMNANYEDQLAMRTCKDRSAPNSWQLVEGAYNAGSASNAERNTGEYSAPTGAAVATNPLFQLGLAVRRTGSGNPRVTIRAAGAVRRA
jgi:hypothetical protein